LRYQTAADLRVDLVRLERDLAGGAPTRVYAVAVPQTGRAATRTIFEEPPAPTEAAPVRVTAAGLALAVAALLVVVLGVWRLVRSGAFARTSPSPA
jgi:hypothetical protein